MADMKEFSKKSEFPSQTENRRQWILDVVRENQAEVAEILCDVAYGGEQIKYARQTLLCMQTMDRDAILQPGGILTDEQIEALK